METLNYRKGLLGMLQYGNLQRVVCLLGLFVATGMAQAVSIVDLNILGRLHGTAGAPASSLTVPNGFSGQIDLMFKITSTRTTPEAIDGVAFSLGASDPSRFTYANGASGGVLAYAGPFSASSYSGGTLPTVGDDLTHVLDLAYFDGAASFQPSAFPSTGSIQLVIATVNLAVGSYVFNTVAHPPYVTSVSFQDSAQGIFAGAFDRIGNFMLNVTEVPEPGLFGVLALVLAGMLSRRRKTRFTVYGRKEGR